jgi:hypothetical protein
LGEADVLPTSGSRGCTAAAVELVFHSELEDKDKVGQTLPVYKGEVEFIALEGERLVPFRLYVKKSLFQSGSMDLFIDWKKELRVLEDCSFEEERFYAQQGVDFSSNCAWQKLLKDYGEETLKKYHKWQPKDLVESVHIYSTCLSANTLTQQVNSA